MMNKAFLEDLKKTSDIDEASEIRSDTQGEFIRFRLQLYLAEKLWSIEQLLKHHGGR